MLAAMLFGEGAPEGERWVTEQLGLRMGDLDEGLLPDSSVSELEKQGRMGVSGKRSRPGPRRSGPPAHDVLAIAADLKLERDLGDDRHDVDEHLGGLRASPSVGQADPP